MREEVDIEGCREKKWNTALKNCVMVRRLGWLSFAEAGTRPYPGRESGLGIDE